VPVVRVNGLVRGVFVPGAGHYTVRFSYLPTSFVYGATLSLATAVLLAAIAVSAAMGAWSRRSRPCPGQSGAEETGKIVPHAL
jgi:hypothetical protein